MRPSREAAPIFLKPRLAVGILGGGDSLTSMNALVRLEASNDAAAIDLVLRSAFSSDQEARLVERLRRHQRLRLSLVAEIDGVIAGHIAFSAVKIAGPMTNSTGVGLAPLAIVPELQGRG